MATLYSRLLASELEGSQFSLIDEDRNTAEGVNFLYPDIKKDHKHEYRDFETINWFRDLTIQQKPENPSFKLYVQFL